VDSWVSLMAPDAAEFINPIRDCYEAYVLYSFIMLLEAYTGDLNELLPKLSPEPIAHLGPFCWLRPFHVDKPVMRRLHQGVMQYMILRPFLVLIEIVWKASDPDGYEGGVVDYTRGYAYVVFIVNISQTVALYCLVYMYLILHKPLHEHNPLGKFLAIKAVVFFSFWQTCLFQVLETTGVIGPAFNYSSKQVCTMLSDFCLIIEMLGFSALHIYVFPYDRYRQDTVKGLWDTPWLYNEGADPSASPTSSAKQAKGQISGDLSKKRREAFASAIKQSDVAEDVTAHFLRVNTESPQLSAADGEDQLAEDELDSNCLGMQALNPTSTAKESKSLL